MVCPRTQTFSRLRLIICKLEGVYTTRRTNNGVSNSHFQYHSVTTLGFPDDSAHDGLRGGNSRTLLENNPYGFLNTQANLLLAERGQGDTPITVCVVDSGYSLGHPDLPGNSGINPGTDPATDCAAGSDTQFGTWYTDVVAHGTHVSGTISMIGNNGQGYIGINPTCNKDASGNSRFKIVQCRGLDDTGSGNYSGLLTAIQNCCINTHAAKVVNLSLGSGGDPGVQDTFKGFYEDAGILVIASAGNR
jgi:serine protease